MIVYKIIQILLAVVVAFCMFLFIMALYYSFLKMRDEMEKEIDHCYTDEIVCPWCGYEGVESWELLRTNTFSGEIVCEECGKTFTWEADFDVTYCTSKKE